MDVKEVGVKPVNLLLPLPMYIRLKEMKERTGISVRALIVQALGLYLNKMENDDRNVI